MDRRIELHIGDKIVVKGEDGYIVRILRSSGSVHWDREGERRLHIIAVRIKSSREIVFLRLMSNTKNNAEVMLYDEAKQRTNNFREYYRIDKVIIKV